MYLCLDTITAVFMSLCQTIWRMTTGDRAADIRKLEVDDEEWELLKQLRDVLKVSLVTVSH